MNNFYILISKIQEQIDNNVYQAEGESYFSSVNIGDYVFIKNKKILKLGRIESLDLDSDLKTCKYSVIYDLNPGLDIDKFGAIDLFVLNKNLLVYGFKTPNQGQAFYKIKIVDEASEAIILNENSFKEHIQDENNIRKIKLCNENEINPNSIDIQLYYKDGEYKLFINDSFMDREEIINKYDYNNFNNGKDAGNSKKKTLYTLIENGEKEIDYKKCSISGFYDLFISDRKKKEKRNNRTSEEDSNEEEIVESYELDEHKAILVNKNTIVYGIPGCGKSWYVNNVLLKDFKKDYIIRTTFHPDYSNTDFIGQLRPIKDKKGIDYKVVPGPFTKALLYAFKNKDKAVALVIEEINRGNASAIFGDIFQLLDRSDSTGESEYYITNKAIEDYFADEGIIVNSILLPKNLYIFATMNTSDQNVYKLDTAFKRRWTFKRLTNEYNKKIDGFNEKCRFGIEGSCIDDWVVFVESINKIILSNKDDLNGDRQLGYWFVKKGITNEEFANKVLEYLYNDVLKYAEKSLIFKSTYESDSFDKIYDDFINGKNVFNDNVVVTEQQSTCSNNNN